MAFEPSNPKVVWAMTLIARARKGLQTLEKKLDVLQNTCEHDWKDTGPTTNMGEMPGRNLRCSVCGRTRTDYSNKQVQRYKSDLRR